MSSAILAKKCCCGPGEPTGDNCLFRWTMVTHHTAVVVDLECDPEDPNGNGGCSCGFEVVDPAIAYEGQSWCLFEGDPLAGVIHHAFLLPKAWRTGCCIGLDIGAGPLITEVLDGVPGFHLNPSPFPPFYFFTPYTPPSVHIVSGTYATGTVFTTAPWNSNFASRRVVLDVCIPGMGGAPFYLPAAWWATDADGQTQVEPCVVRLYYGQPVGTPQPEEFRLAKIEIGSPQGYSCPPSPPAGAYRSILPPFTDDPDYAAIGSPPLVLPFGTC